MLMGLIGNGCSFKIFAVEFDVALDFIVVEFYGKQ